MNIVKRGFAAFLGVFAMLAAFSAHAVSPLDPLVAAVSFTDVATAVVAVAVLLAGLYVTLKAVRTVLHFVRS